MMKKKCSYAEVDRFLQRKRKHYEDILKQIRDMLRDFSTNEVAEGVGLTVYSRGEKQKGSELKERWKIVAKVNQARFNEYSWDSTSSWDKEAPSSNFEISDLNDIVGVTAVVRYNSDVLRLREFIDDRISKRNWSEHKKFKSHVNDEDGAFGIKKNKNGYYAYHYVLENKSDPILRGILCELQIKTMLHDSLAAKTHDLTYKPQGALNVKLRQQIEVLGDSLEAVERQSELLRSLIQEQWIADEIPKRNARDQILDWRIQTADISKQGIFDSIREKIKSGDFLGDTKSVDRRLKAIQSEIDEFCEGNYGHDACRLLVGLAVRSERLSIINTALERIVDWSLSALEPEEQFEALHFKSLAHYCFDQIIFAINSVQEALNEFEAELLSEKCGRIDAKEAVLKSYNSLAYYFAEIAGSDAAVKMEANQRAVKLAESAKELAEELGWYKSDNSEIIAKRCMIENTLGAIRIAYARTGEEAREGLSRCQAALDTVRDKSPGSVGLFEQYQLLHERWAWRKILELE